DDVWRATTRANLLGDPLHGGVIRHVTRQCFGEGAELRGVRAQRVGRSCDHQDSHLLLDQDSRDVEPDSSRRAGHESSSPLEPAHVPSYSTYWFGVSHSTSRMSRAGATAGASTRQMRTMKFSVVGMTSRMKSTSMLRFR